MWLLFIIECSKQNKKPVDIPKNNKLQQQIQSKHSLFSLLEDIVQNRDNVVQAIFRHQL